MPSTWQDPLRARLTGLQLTPAREAEIIEELSQHLDDRFEELRRAGVNDAEARRLAIEEIDELDDHELLRREMQPLRQASIPPPIVPGHTRGRLTTDLWHDVRYAARMFTKQPGFTLAAVLTLALGIGANAAIFSLVNATLFRRLPVRATEQLVYVFNGGVGGVFPYPGYAALRDGTRTLDGLAAWGPITASLNADAETDLVSGVIVTGNFFELLGISAQRGRLLARSDDVTVGAHPVAVVSDRLWRQRFGGRADIVGHQILLNGRSFTIVGVTKRDFFGPQVGTVRDLYVPMMMQAVMRPPRAGYSGEMDPDLLKNPGNSWLFTMGRLKPGQTPEQVSAEMAGLWTTFVRTLNPALTPRRVPVLGVDEGNPDQQQQLRRVALLLGGVVAAVLLIACANVANLLISRAASRRRELAVRIAIGANRWRLLRQLLTESVLLSTVGGAAGIGLAWLVAAAFRAAPPPAGALPIAVDFAMDLRVLFFALGLSTFTGLVFGIGPAISASRPSLVPALKDGTDQTSRGRRFGLKKVLVIAEVALSLVLLVAAGLFVRSVQRTYEIDPGFDADRLLSAPLNVNLLRYTRAQGRDFYQRAVERVTALPGVQSAGVARVAMLTGGGRTASFIVEGRAGSDNVFRSEGSTATDQNSVRVNVVGPGFFETLGVPRLSGRGFASADADTSTPVAMVNDTTVRQHFPGVEPIGRRVSLQGPNGPWIEIVGVVRDSAYATLGEQAASVVYLPLSQNHETGVTLYVRAAVPPATLISAVRQEIQALEPNLPVPGIRIMQDTIGTSLYAPRMGAWLLSVFGGLALLLATVGVYGVLSFSIARRTREMGVRIALGAGASRVFGLVIREGMGLVAIGIALGLAGGWFAVRSLSTFLYGVQPTDLATFGTVTILLALVALAACIIPARRAMRVNPITALRAD